MSTTQSSTPTVPARLQLVACLVLGGAAALTIHLGMLYAGVPFPTSDPPRWARQINAVAGILAVISVATLGKSRLLRFGAGAAILIVFASVAMIRETLRGALMSGVVTGGWAFGFIAAVEPTLRVLLIAVLCILSLRWVRSATSFVAMGAVVSLGYLVIQPWLTSFVSPMALHFSYLQQADRYEFPYPLVVLVPAYLSFLEPVIGASLAAWLVWDRLPQSPFVRVVIFAFLIAQAKGVLVMTFAFSFFATEPYGASVLAYGQFLFEFMTLGISTGLAWQKFGVPNREAYSTGEQVGSG